MEAGLFIFLNVKKDFHLIEHFLDTMLTKNEVK